MRCALACLLALLAGTGCHRRLADCGDFARAIQSSRLDLSVALAGPDARSKREALTADSLDKLAATLDHPSARVELAGPTQAYVKLLRGTAGALRSPLSSPGAGRALERGFAVDEAKAFNNVLALCSGAR